MKLKPSYTVVNVIELADKLSLFTAEKGLGARGKSGSYYQPQIS
jgi:hypothetical protein